METVSGNVKLHVFQVVAFDTISSRTHGRWAGRMTLDKHIAAEHGVYILMEFVESLGSNLWCREVAKALYLCSCVYVCRLGERGDIFNLRFKTGVTNS